MSSRCLPWDILFGIVSIIFSIFRRKVILRLDFSSDALKKRRMSAGGGGPFYLYFLSFMNSQNCLTMIIKAVKGNNGSAHKG